MGLWEPKDFSGLEGRKAITSVISMGLTPEKRFEDFTFIC
jgi:hypothetical protein